MMFKAKLSVIIATYNRAQFLSHAIESVLRQTWQNCEAIVVDDGSTDSTPSLMAQFSDPRIKYIRQQNAGVAAARNQGIASATGDFIAFLDDDDFLHPEFGSRLIGALEEDQDSGFAYCFAELVDTAGKPIGKHRSSIKNISGNLFTDYVFKKISILIPCCVFRKNAIQAVGKFDAKLNPEDFDFLLRATSSFRARGIDGHYVFVRKHNSSEQRSGIDTSDRIISYGLAHITAVNRFLADPKNAEKAIPPFFKRRFAARKFNYIARHLMKVEDRAQALRYASESFRSFPLNPSAIWKILLLQLWDLGGGTLYRRIYQFIRQISNDAIRERMRHLLK